MGDHCGVPRNSLVLVAAVSAILCGQDKNLAKRVLKATETDSKLSVYNPMSDFEIIEAFHWRVCNVS